MQCDFTGDEGPGPEDLNQNHPRVDTPVRCTRSNRSFHMRSPDSMVPDQARSPPSTVRQAPVVKPLSSAAKKRIAFAISCGSCEPTERMQSLPPRPPGSAIALLVERPLSHGRIYDGGCDGIHSDSERREICRKCLW